MESEQPIPSRAARKLFLLPKNLCERGPTREAPTHDPTTSVARKAQKTKQSHHHFKPLPMGPKTNQRQRDGPQRAVESEHPTPRAQRESSSSFRRISANAGPTREAPTHDPTTSVARKAQKNPII